MQVSLMRAASASWNDVTINVKPSLVMRIVRVFHIVPFPEMYGSISG